MEPGTWVPGTRKRESLRRITTQKTTQISSGHQEVIFLESRQPLFQHCRYLTFFVVTEETVSIQIISLKYCETFKVLMNLIVR